jgi:hypothetical protein
MRDLVFVKFNSKLRNKRERKDRDPLEREVDDDENEFITGIIASPNEVAEESPKDGPSQGESTSQAQVQAKRKRHVPSRKKRKVRSLQSLMHDTPVQQSSSDSEDGDGNVTMESSESDKSPYSD